MATSIGTAWIQIKPSLKGLSRDIEDALGGSSVNGGRKISTNLKGVFSGLSAEIRNTFSNAFSAVSSTASKLLTAGMTGAVGLVGSQIGAAVSRIDTLNNAPRVFKAMGYSASTVTREMAGLNDYLRGLPTSLDGAVRNVQSLSASFGGVEKGTRIFKAMNNAGLAFGASSAMIDNAIMQLGQTSLTGPLDAATWNSLRNSGFEPVFAAMAKKAGKTVGELKEEFGGRGTKTVQDFLDQLIELDEKGGGGMESLAKMARLNTNGIKTSFTNMRTSVVRSIADMLNGIPNLSESIQGVGKAFEGIMSGKMSVDDGAKLIDNFVKNVVNAIAKVAAKLAPLVMKSLTTLVHEVTNMLTKALNDGDNTKKLIAGFVELFVAVAKAGSLIALAIIPLIPTIISQIVIEITKPENSGTLAAGFGLLIGYAVAKTIATNGFVMAKNSMKNLIQKLFTHKEGAADKVVDDIKKVSKEAKKTPKKFTFGESFKDFFKNIGQVLSGALDMILQPLKTLAQGATDIFKTVLKGAGEGLAGMLKALANPELLLGAVVLAAGAGAIALAIWAIGSAIGAVSPALGDFLNTVIIPLGTFLLGVLVVALTTITILTIRLTNEAVIPLVNAVSGGLTQAFNSIGGVITSAGNAISSVVNSITGGIANVINSVANLLRSVGGQDWYGTGYGITRNFSAGIVDGLVDLLQDSLNNIINAILGAPGVGNALKAAGVKNSPINLRGFRLGRRAQGGAVFGPGSDTSDSIPMALSNGEYVIRAATARKIGYKNLDSLNATGDMSKPSQVIVNINGYNKDPEVLADEVSKKIALRRRRVIG